VLVQLVAHARTPNVSSDRTELLQRTSKSQTSSAKYMRAHVFKDVTNLAPVVEETHVKELFESPAGRLVCEHLRELLFDGIHLHIYTHTYMHRDANSCTVCRHC